MFPMRDESVFIQNIDALLQGRCKVVAEREADITIGLLFVGRAKGFSTTLDTP